MRWFWRKKISVNNSNLNGFKEDNSSILLLKDQQSDYDYVCSKSNRCDGFDKINKNKADRHKSRALSHQRPTDGRTDQQSVL